MDTTTDATEYTKLFDLLKSTIHPIITHADGVLSGPDLRALSVFESAKVNIRYVRGPGQSVAPALDFTNAVAV